MNLVIDKGNTRTKAGLFRGGECIQTFFWDVWGQAEMEEMREKGVERVILSTVSGIDEKVAIFLTNTFTYLKLDTETQLPVQNAYETPETLGKDRIAAVVGARHLFPAENCLVIDAGTCITLDFLSSEGVYLGGNISPGIGMRLRAMHQFTHSLPQVAPGDMTGLLGQSTETALRLGGQMGPAMELNGFTEALAERYGEFKVLLTGGDAVYLAGNLKRKIFVNPNLVLIGLNEILTYNVQLLE